MPRARIIRLAIGALAAMAVSACGIIKSDPASDWQTPKLASGFTNAGAGAAPVGYYKDASDRVYLRGVVQSTQASPSDAKVFVLDEGVRPVYTHRFNVLFSLHEGDIVIWAAVQVSPDGVVSVSGANIETFSLDQVSFRTR
ncbi:MAG TPA: hypothetical protein VNT22_02830 [Baekduia sp.]|nr:hypothetical protein [Baekduia sp.]